MWVGQKMYLIRHMEDGAYVAVPGKSYTKDPHHAWWFKTSQEAQAKAQKDELVIEFDPSKS